MTPSKKDNQADFCPVCNAKAVTDNVHKTKFGNEDYRLYNKKCQVCHVEFWPEEEARVESDNDHNMVCHQDVLAVVPGVGQEKEEIRDLTLTWPI